MGLIIMFPANGVMIIGKTAKKSNLCAKNTQWVFSKA